MDKIDEWIEWTDDRTKRIIHKERRNTMTACKDYMEQLLIDQMEEPEIDLYIEQED